LSPLVDFPNCRGRQLRTEQGRAEVGALHRPSSSASAINQAVRMVANVLSRRVPHAVRICLSSRADPVRHIGHARFQAGPATFAKREFPNPTRKTHPLWVTKAGRSLLPMAPGTRYPGSRDVRLRLRALPNASSMCQETRSLIGPGPERIDLADDAITGPA